MAGNPRKQDSQTQALKKVINSQIKRYDRNKETPTSSINTTQRLPHNIINDVQFGSGENFGMRGIADNVTVFLSSTTLYTVTATQIDRNAFVAISPMWLRDNLPSNMIEIGTSVIGIPAGGDSGMVLMKLSASDYHVGWVTL